MEIFIMDNGVKIILMVMVNIFRFKLGGLIKANGKMEFKKATELNIIKMDQNT